MLNRVHILFVALSIRCFSFSVQVRNNLPHGLFIISKTINSKFNGTKSFSVLNITSSNIQYTHSNIVCAINRLAAQALCFSCDSLSHRHVHCVVFHSKVRLSYFAVLPDEFFYPFQIAWRAPSNFNSSMVSKDNTKVGNCQRTCPTRSI